MLTFHNLWFLDRRAAVDLYLNNSPGLVISNYRLSLAACLINGDFPGPVVSQANAPTGVWLQSCLKPRPWLGKLTYCARAYRLWSRSATEQCIYCREKLSWYASRYCVFYWLCVSHVNDIKEYHNDNRSNAKKRLIMQQYIGQESGMLDEYGDS